MPGIIPIKLPINEHLKTKNLLAKKSLKPWDHPVFSKLAFSLTGLLVLSNSTISGTAKIEIAITIKCIPPLK